MRRKLNTGIRLQSNTCPLCRRHTFITIESDGQVTRSGWFIRLLCGPCYISRAPEWLPLYYAITRGETT